MKAALTILSTVVILAAAVLFWIALDERARLGGQTVLDRPDGRFFVARRGARTEVSEEDWRNLRALEVALMATFPLGLLALMYLNFAVVISALTFRAPAEERDARVREIAATGPALATRRCVGQIGRFGVRSAFFYADVHPGGLIVRVRWIGSTALRASEIKSIDVETSFRLLSKAARIEHTSDHARSPIRLACGKDVAFMDALNGLTDRRS